MPALDNITTTTPVYQLQTQGLPGYNLMNYGMAGNAPYEFVKAVQTGEVTFDSTDPNHQQMIDEYEARRLAGDAPPDAPSWGQILGATAVGVAGPIVANTFGQAYANTGGNISEALTSTFKNPLSGGKNLEAESLKASFENSRLLGDDFRAGDTWIPNLNKVDTSNMSREQLNAVEALRKGASPEGVLKGGLSKTALDTQNKNIGISKLEPKTVTAETRGSIWTDKGNIGSSIGIGAMSFAASLIAGEGAKKAAKRAVGTGLGKYLGTAISSMMGFTSPIGGYVGSLIGGAAGGRVICNELMRQGVLDRKHVLLDYRFTRDYLTPTHVNGYHVWAVWMVKQMRKGKFVKFWKHVAGHRANEIAYIYGERDKPDYLGKVYRKILEPICWSIGVFCKKSDWSILYKTKEI